MIGIFYKLSKVRTFVLHTILSDLFGLQILNEETAQTIKAMRQTDFINM